jgi:hypothetical protein
MPHSAGHTRWVAAASAVFLIAVAIAYAANPHFINNRTRATINNQTGQVIVSWKEAGLGKNQNITYVATADAVATYHCVNNGGQCPNAANKMSVQGPVAASGAFNSGKNGQITASLTINPPPVAAFCPSGQTEVLAEVTYSNVQVTDTTNGITAFASPVSLSATLFTCP